MSREQKENEIAWEIKLFHKLGGYYKWTWKEFCDTPWYVIKQLSRLLDEKEGDMNQFISMEEAAMFKCLRRLYPSKD